MDSFEKEMGFPRGTKTVVLELGTPGRTDYLRKEYQLPDPYTVEEYSAAITDIQAHWDKGERTQRAVLYE